MALSSTNARNELMAALGNNSSRIVIDKATIASQGAGTFVSMWRATGQPGQGAIPSAAAVCDNDGSIGWLHVHHSLDGREKNEH